jgi:hypothetical protein
VPTARCNPGSARSMKENRIAGVELVLSNAYQLSAWSTSSSLGNEYCAMPDPVVSPGFKMAPTLTTESEHDDGSDVAS